MESPAKVFKPKFKFNLDQDNVQRILDRRRQGKLSSSKLQKGLRDDEKGGGGPAGGSGAGPSRARQELLYIPREMLVMSRDELARAKQSSMKTEYKNPERWIVPKKKVISSRTNLSNEKANIASRIAREVRSSRASRCLVSANQEIGEIGPVRRVVKHDPYLQGFLCKDQYD